MPCEDEGRDLNDASRCQGKPKIVSKPANHEEPRERHRVDSSEGINPDNTLIMDS